MNKTILKLRLSDYWRIGEHESWFTDMAANGLHLKKTGVIFASFEKGEPKDMRYRIEVTKDRLTEEQKNLYKEYGWRFVTSYGKFNVFSSPEILGAPELHTDAAEQSYTLKALDASLRQNVVIMSIAVVLILGILLSMFFLINTPFLSVIEGAFLQQCMIILIEFYSLCATLQASRSIRALRKSLSEGKPIDHRANWRKNRWISKVVGGGFIIAGIITIILPVMTLTKMETYTLPDGESSLPIVRLVEIENNPNLVRDSYYMKDSIDWNNSLSYSWSPFAPIQYKVQERGIISGSMWKDGSGQYSPSISTQYYKLTFAGMSEGLIHDMIKRNLFREDEEIQIISHPDFDNLCIVDKDETKHIYASIGAQVIYIRYYGYADINQIIDIVSARFSVETK